MRILIVYATTDGQTRKIARFAADRLVAAGHGVELLNAEDTGGLDLGRFDGAILAASVHVAVYQKALVGFARERAGELAKLPTLFLSVSLSAAGDDPEDQAGLAEILQRFLDVTGWRPGRVEQVAGAFRFGEYDFFKAWAMRWIERKKDPAAKPGEDKEYTDWAALGSLLDDWAKGLGAG
jgi:menaquinone-dependent protoporphyrinogen oxidase